MPVGFSIVTLSRRPGRSMSVSTMRTDPTREPKNHGRHRGETRWPLGKSCGSTMITMTSAGT